MKPLVFVHGFMGGSRQWSDQCRALDGLVETVTLDLPGFGENADLTAPSSIAAFARWVLDALTVKGIRQFHLLGHSMGGMIAQEMVVQAADRVDRLVLYGTGAIGVLPGRFESIGTSKSRAEQDGARATARRIAATWFLDRDKAEAYPDCASIAEQAGLPAILSGLDAMNGWTASSNLPNISSQTLIVWGDRDRTYPWSQIEHLWTSIPKASLAVVPNCAHAVHLENPKIFNQLLLDFFRSPSLQELGQSSLATNIPA